MRTVLTKRICALAEPTEKPYELRDTNTRGLILRIQPSGYKGWYVEWTRGKRRRLGSYEHLALEQARAYARQAVAEHVQQGLPSIARATASCCTLRMFLNDRYQAWAVSELKGGAQYVRTIERVFAVELDQPLTGLDPDWADRWWQVRTQVVSKTSASRNLACLRSAMSKAVEWRLLDKHPLAGLRRKAVPARKVVRYLSDAEEARLRAVLANRDRFMVAARQSANLWRQVRGQALYPVLAPDDYGDHVTPVVLLAMNTGLRRGELLSLRWSDIDLSGRMLTVRAEQAKSGKQRHVPLNDEAHAVLVRWRSYGTPQDRVFRVRDIKTAYKAVLDAADIDNFRFHDLRHHFASKLVRAGVDLNTVRELLGHADMTMTLRYAHLCPQTLAAAVAKLGG